MPYYVSRLPNGFAKIHFTKPENEAYIEVSELPNENEAFAFTDDGQFYKQVEHTIAFSGPSNDDKIKALSDYQDFLEECIVEMAQEVYK